MKEIGRVVLTPETVLIIPQTHIFLKNPLISDIHLQTGDTGKTGGDLPTNPQDLIEYKPGLTFMTGQDIIFEREIHAIWVKVKRRVHQHLQSFTFHTNEIVLEVVREAVLITDLAPHPLDILLQERGFHCAMVGMDTQGDKALPFYLHILLIALGTAFIFVIPLAIRVRGDGEALILIFGHIVPGLTTLTSLTGLIDLTEFNMMGDLRAVVLELEEDGVVLA